MIDVVKWQQYCSGSQSAVEELIQRFSQHGHTVLRDQWKGHAIHDEDTSHSLLKQADLVICEWSLGNSVWYSNHKKPNQRLYIRFIDKK